MKTISTSSPHCSIFRCQASGACDLLLKNKYVRKRRLPRFYQQFIKMPSSRDGKSELFRCVLFLNEIEVWLGWHIWCTGFATQNDLPIHLKMASRQSVRAANFIISIGEQLDRRPRKWHLLWVIEFSCCGLRGGPGRKKNSFKWNKTSLLEFWRRADLHQQSKSYPKFNMGRYKVVLVYRSTESIILKKRKPACNCNM